MPPIQNNMGQDVGPEKRANLQNMINEMNSQGSQLNANQFAQKNQGEAARQDALLQVFQMMQEAGIDPNNLEQVRAFLDQLEQQNPELYAAFVEAFELLLGGAQGEMPIPEGTEEGAGMVPPTGGPAQQFPGLAGQQ